MGSGGGGSDLPGYDRGGDGGAGGGAILIFANTINYNGTITSDGIGGGEESGGAKGGSGSGGNIRLTGDSISLGDFSAL